MSNTNNRVLNGQLFNNVSVIANYDNTDDGSIEASGTLFVNTIREYNISDPGVNIENSYFEKGQATITSTAPSTNRSSASLVVLGGISVAAASTFYGNLNIIGTNTINSLVATSGNISIGTIGNLNNKSITTGSLISNTGQINSLTASNLIGNAGTFGSLIAGNTTVSNLVGTNINIGNASFGNLISTKSTIGSLISNTGQINSLTVSNATVSNLIAINTQINNLTTSNLIASNATVSNFVSTNISVGNATVSNLTASNLTGNAGTFGSLIAGNATAGNLTAGVITAQNASISIGLIDNIISTNGTISNLINTASTVGSLNVEELTGNDIVTTTLHASSETVGSLLVTSKLNTIDSLNIITSARGALTMSVPDTMSTAYTLNFPTKLPTSSGSVLTLSSSGNVTYDLPTITSFFNSTNLINNVKVWTGATSSTNGKAIFYPTTTNTTVGAPLFSTIFYTNAVAPKTITNAKDVLITGLDNIATNMKTITYNVVTGAGLLLGGNTLVNGSDGNRVVCIAYGIL